MITRREDYRFVTGDDLEKIKVDGGIMPLRVGREKMEMRGEDIAFLLEATAERMSAVGSVPGAVDFTREIKADQVQTILLRTRNLWTRFAPPSIVARNAVYDAMPSHDYANAAADSLSGADWVSVGDEAKSDPIEHLFADVKRLVKWRDAVTTPRVDEYRVTANVADIGEGGDPWDPTIPLGGGVYCYRMEAWGTTPGRLSPTNGSREWRGKTAGAAVTNDYAKAATFIVTFKVAQSTNAGASTEYVDIVTPTARFGNTFIVTDATIYQAAKDALSLAGFAATPYPGRPTGNVAIWQDIAASIEGIVAIMELRDRTRW